MPITITTVEDFDEAMKRLADLTRSTHDVSQTVELAELVAAILELDRTTSPPQTQAQAID